MGAKPKRKANSDVTKAGEGRVTRRQTGRLPAKVERLIESEVLVVRAAATAKKGGEGGEGEGGEDDDGDEEGEGG